MKKELIKRRTVILLVLGLASIFIFGTSILHVSAKKQFTNESIEGTYGFSASGNIIGFGPANITGPIVIIGLSSFDGDGVCSLKETVNAVQPIGTFSFTATSCTYKVNPDGAGNSTVIFTLPSGQINHINVSFVIVINGREILLVQTDPGDIISGIAKRQEMGDS